MGETAIRFGKVTECWVSGEKRLLDTIAIVYWMSGSRVRFVISTVNEEGNGFYTAALGSGLRCLSLVIHIRLNLLITSLTWPGIALLLDPFVFCVQCIEF